MRASIQMMKAQEGPESRGVLLAMIEYRDYLKSIRKDSEAENIDRELSLAMQRQSPVCATCVSVHSLSNAMR